MTQISKSKIIGIIVAAIVLVAALIFLACHFMHKNDEHHGMDHASMGHDTGNDKHTALDEAGEGITVVDGYARTNGASAKAGAAFMVVKNFTDTDDRLIGASTTAANKAELHTHNMDANGVMSMGPIEGGIALLAHSQIALKRGGDHVMMMGLTQSLNQGDTFTLTLTFEKRGEITFEVTIDLKRK